MDRRSAQGIVTRDDLLARVTPALSKVSSEGPFQTCMLQNRILKATITIPPAKPKPRTSVLPLPRKAQSMAPTPTNPATRKARFLNLLGLARNTFGVSNASITSHWQVFGHSARRLESSNRLAQKPAVHADVRAGDETAGRRTGQEEARADEFTRLAEAAHRGVSPNGLRARGRRAVVVEEQLAILFGREKTRGDRVHAHALRRPFAREELRQVQHSRLGRRVGDDARQRHVRGDAGDVDDAAPATPAHRRAELLARQQHAADQIQIEVGLPVLDLDLLEQIFSGDRDFRIVAAGRVDENGWGAQPRFDLAVRLGEAGARNSVRSEE